MQSNLQRWPAPDEGFYDLHGLGQRAIKEAWEKSVNKCIEDGAKRSDVDVIMQLVDALNNARDGLNEWRIIAERRKNQADNLRERIEQKDYALKLSHGNVDKWFAAYNKVKDRVDDLELENKKLKMNACDPQICGHGALEAELQRIKAENQNLRIKMAVGMADEHLPEPDPISAIDAEKHSGITNLHKGYIMSDEIYEYYEDLNGNPHWKHCHMGPTLHQEHCPPLNNVVSYTGNGNR